jgi:nicotinate (nicotinamide) nucleotide adenylyltransferase
MKDLAQIRQDVADGFEAAFGRTPLAERVLDIIAQAGGVGRYVDMEHLRDETGDLLASVLQLCNECGWDPADLIASTMEKITARQAIYKRLGRKMRVALLGGAFDPIHRGHMEVARSVLKYAGVDEVWLMPCFEHMYGKSMIAAEHRLEMSRIAARSVTGVRVFDYELRNQFRGETYHLVKKLLDDDLSRLECDFSLIIGQDNADDFRTWTNGEALARLIPVVVVPRPGCNVPRFDAWYTKMPHRFLAEAPSDNAISSTQVRGLLHERNAAAAEPLLPPGVYDYIRTNKLYGPKQAVVGTGPVAHKTAIFVSTFDPPSLYHRAAAERLLDTGFDRVVVCPAFSLAGGGGQPQHAASMHRAALVDLNFAGLPQTSADFSELERTKPVGYGMIEAKYEQDAEVWHVVDVEHMIGGGSGRSNVQTAWEKGSDRWNRGRFVVLHRPGDEPNLADLPPRHQLLPMDNHVSTAELRRRIFAGQSIHDRLHPEVAGYIERHALFTSYVPGRHTKLRLDEPRLLIEYDERNPNASALASQYRRYASDRPNLILSIGGDGTMLHAIRRHWRLRIPFLGLNAGHLGFLANERLPADLAGVEFVTHLLPMLSVESQTPDGRLSRHTAFGDAWVEREGGQAAWLQLEIDGQVPIKKLVGDGLLIATASGSSAYARALGASPVPLNAPVLTLAGSNVFQPRFWKPMALADDTEVSVVSLDRSGKRPVRGFVDGQPLGIVQSMRIRRSPVANVELAFVGEFDPSIKMFRSLFPPTDAS